MPVYLNKPYRGGFYKNIKTNGKDDRTYSALDMRKPYDVIFSDGIKPSYDGTAGDNLKVVAIGNRMIAVLPGYAKLGGAWFECYSQCNIQLDTVTADNRYDCVILKNDDNDISREPDIYIKTIYGDEIPNISNLGLQRENGVYEVCLAYIRITSANADVTSEMITDTRLDGSLCNVMSGVGTTVVRTLTSRYITKNTNESVIPIGIDEYIKGTDELVVMVEGRTFKENVNYTILSNKEIKLEISLPKSGTIVDFIVRRNVAGAANGDTNTELVSLHSDVAAIKNKLEHHYYCTGVNDNIHIGDLVRELLEGTGYGSVKLNIHGQLVGYQPALSNDTTDYWFNFNVTTDRKVVLDFTDCSQIIIPTTNGKTNVIFYGKEINMIGANLIVNNTTTNTAIVAFDSSVEIINCENCRFWITGYKYSYIARNGTFTNCRGSVTNSNYYSYCFYTSGLVRLFGGEYYAYTADSNAKSAVVGQTGSNTITLMYGVNAPEVERVGYYQTNAVNHIGTAGNSGVICCTDLISVLDVIEHNGTDNYRGTIKLNKPGLM